MRVWVGGGEEVRGISDVVEMFFCCLFVLFDFIFFV